MSDFVKEFSIEEVIKSSDKRRFIAYGSVEMYDRHNQLIPITEFYKSMSDYMSNSRILLDQHSNKPVGNLLNWERAEKNGHRAIKVTGEIWKDSRSADKVWKEIQDGEREGISVGGSTETITKDEMGEVLRGIQIDEFSIVKRCGNQGATFDVISMAKSDEDPCWDGYEQVGMKTKNGKKVPNCVPKGDVEKESDEEDNQDEEYTKVRKQTNDMEQTTQDDVNIQDNEKIEALEQKYELLLNEISSIKSLLSSKPTNLSDMEVEKMENQKEVVKNEEATIQTTQDVTKEETPVTETVEKQDVAKEETVKEEFDIKKFAQTIQEQLNNLTSQVQDLQKSSETNKEVTNIVKTEAPSVESTPSEFNKAQDIIKQIESGEITREEAMQKLAN